MQGTGRVDSEQRGNCVRSFGFRGTTDEGGLATPDASHCVHGILTAQLLSFSVGGDSPMDRQGGCCP